MNGCIGTALVWASCFCSVFNGLCHKDFGDSGQFCAYLVP